MTETEMLSDEQVAEIEARANTATEGPWTAYHRVSPRGAYKQWHIGNKEGLCQITMSGHERDYQFMAHARTDIPALCQTVRALRATHSCGTVDSGSVVGGCGKEVLTTDGFRCADCLAWFHRDCINEHFKLDAYVKKLRELREQGAIDDWKKSLADKEAENTALRDQLAQLQQSQESTLDHNRSLIAELAQVQKELSVTKQHRDDLIEELRREQQIGNKAPMTRLGIK